MKPRRSIAWAALLIAGHFAVAASGPGGICDTPTLDDYLKRADELDRARDTTAAAQALEDADAKFPNNPEVLYRLSKQHSDLIFAAKSKPEAKALAAKCLATARRAVEAGPKHAKARLSLSICYAKNFPHVDNQTKVNYSRALKEETERAIALDPTLDLAHHMLGRWHFESANMNFVTRTLAAAVYGGLPKASFESARAGFHRAVELAPKRILHRLHLAGALLALKKKPEAIEALRTALKLEPLDKDDEEARRDAAAALKKLGVKDAAE